MTDCPLYCIQALHVNVINNTYMELYAYLNVKLLCIQAKTKLLKIMSLLSNA